MFILVKEEVVERFVYVGFFETCSGVLTEAGGAHVEVIEVVVVFSPKSAVAEVVGCAGIVHA